MLIRKLAFGAIVLSLSAVGQAHEHEAEETKSVDAGEIPEIVVVAEKIEAKTQPLIASQDTQASVHGAVLEDLNARLEPVRSSVE